MNTKINTKINSKKTLGIFLSFMLLFSFGSGFFTYAKNGIDQEIVYSQAGTGKRAKEKVSVEEAGEYLRQLGLYVGYEDGSLGLERNITRTEFAVLAIRLLGLESQEAGHRGRTGFKDVSDSFWGTGYINIALAKGLVVGDTGTNTFRPEGQITYAEAVTVLIRLLGYEKDIKGSWPNNYLNKAEDLGLTESINLAANTPINRGQIALLIYNALDVVVK